MAVELEFEVPGRPAEPVEMAVKVEDSGLRIEAHGLDEVEVGRVGRHEFPLQQAFGPFILQPAVDDKPRPQTKPRDGGSAGQLERADEDVEAGIAAWLDPAHAAGVGA